MRHLPVRVLFGIAIFGVLVAVPAAAVQSTVDLLLDLDDDAGTGCTVTTADGPFAGVEQILTTTVDTVGTSAANVTSVVRSECTDPGTNTFGAPVAVDPGGWPVGVGLGLDGFHVVETYFPLSATPIDPKLVRIGVVHTRGMTVDTLLVATPGTTDPILLDLRSVLEIPTLGEWGLILLAALLAAGSLYVLGRRGVAVLVLVLAVGTAGLAWAQCVLDGDPGDWTPGDLIGADGAAVDDGISIRALFGRGEAGNLCFRIDLSLQFDQPPTITGIADQSVPEDTSTGPLAFTVGDLEDAAGTLMVTATSSNQILVPDGNLTLGGAGANRTIDVTPAANQNGMAVVTLTVQDSAGNMVQTSFMVTVTSANDPPTITAIADQVILEDSTTGALAFTVGDVETPVGSLMVSATSTDTTVIPNANLVLGGSGANRTITVTPAADQNGGPVTINVVVQDTDGGSTPESFTVTVTPVNDAPSFTLAGDVMSDEDAGLQTVMNQAAAISAGPANEAGQTVSFVVSNDDNALFSAQPAIDAAGTLTYTSAANANGSAIVSVYAMDDGGTMNGGVDTSATQTFTITVNPVNDPPTVVGEVFDVAAGNFDPAIGNTTLQFANSDTVTHPHVYVAGNVLANDSDTDGPSALSLTAYDTTSTMGGSVGMNLATGELTYEPPLGFEGTDSFTYTVTDGATPAVGTVTIEVAGMVWYLDNQTDGTGDDGRSGSPFDTIAQLEAQNGGGAADDPAAGDIIFVHEGSGTYDAGAAGVAGIELLDQQKLWGEGIGLTVLSKTLVPAGNRPVIDNTNAGGDGVTVLANAANGDRSGIEIRGLALNGDDNSVSVTSADAAAVGVTISDDLIDNAGGNGLDLNPGSSGAFSVTVSSNTWTTMSPTANGLDLTTAAGNAADVTLALDGNADITGGGAGVNVNGAAGTGTVYVTSLSGNTVNGATAAGGMVFDTVVFDANPADADFTGDTVNAGTTVVGSGADRVTGPGVVLDTVSGDLSFASLAIFNDAGAGLRVTGGASFNAGAGTGFQLSAPTGAIDTVNGPAVDVDPATLGLTLASVTSSTTAGMTPYGIRLDAVDGSFQVNGATSISASAGGSLGTGILVNNSSAAVTFAGPTTVSTTTGAGIGLNNAGGPFVVSSTMSNVSGAGGAAIDVDQGTGSVTYDGSITNSAGRSVEITNHAGPPGGSTIALNGAITDTGTGVFLDNNDQGMGGTVINLTGALSLTTGTSNAFTATNGGVVNVTDPSNNNQITTTTGTGVTIADTTIGASGVKLTTVNVGDGNAAAPNAANGILLSNVGAGTFTATGGAIQNATTRGLDVAGGNGAVSVGASLGSTGSGRSVEVTGRSGGAVTISGAIDDQGAGINVANNTGGSTTFNNASKVVDTGANPAVTLATNTGHTVSFTGGGLGITTTSGTGFSATGGGTVNVTGSGNTVASGTGTGVNVANTNIGPMGVTFLSVSSAGGGNAGIVLNGTGAAGGFTITGDGGGSNNGSGGSITSKTGDAITLTDTQDVSLGYMNIGQAGALSNIGDNGIRAIRVDGLTLDHSNLRNVANQTTPDEAALFATDPRGTWNVTSSLFDRSFDDHIRIENDTTTSGFTFNLLDSTLQDNDASGNGNDALSYIGDGGGTGATFVVQRNTFSNSDGDHVQIALAGVASADVTIGGANPADGNMLTATAGTVLGSGITFSSGTDSMANGFQGLLTYLVQNNDIQNAGSIAVNVNLSASSTSGLRYSGTIADNTIGTAGTGFSGGFGIAVNQNGAGTLNTVVQNNQVNQYDGDHGILIQARDGSGRVNATVVGNSVANPADTAVFDGLAINAGATSTDTSVVCADVRSNTLTNSHGSAGGGADFVVATTSGAAGGPTVILPGYGGAAKDAGAVVSFVQGQNVGTPSGAAFFSGNSVGVLGTGSSCP